MKTLGELEREYSAIKTKKIPRSDKIALVMKIRQEIGHIERAAASDFSFPLETIQKTRAFLILIESYMKP